MFLYLLVIYFRLWMQIVLKKFLYLLGDVSTQRSVTDAVVHREALHDGGCRL